MPSRTEILATINDLYAARMRGDMEAVSRALAPGATFQLFGADRVLDVPPGPVDAREAIGRLVDLFEFQEIEQLTAIVDGNQVAFRLRIHFTTNGSNPGVTELCDIWEIGEDGRAISLIEFADTAHMAELLA